MERRGLLWFVALAFSVVLLVQYIELPYGYVVSSLLSIGKSEVASAGSLSTNGLSNETENSAPRIVSGGVNSTKTNAAGSFQNATNFLEEKKSETTDSSNDPVVERSSTEFLELNHSTTNDRVARNKSLAREHVHDLPVSSYTSARNSSVDSLRGTNVVSSSIIDEERDSHASSPQHKGSNQSTHTLKDPGDTVQKRPSLTQSQLSTYVNNSSSRRTPKLTRFKGPPAVVVPISEMNDLLRKSRVSYRSMVWMCEFNTVVCCIFVHCCVSCLRCFLCRNLSGLHKRTKNC